MIPYYEFAIDNGYKKALNRLGRYYELIEKDYSKMLNYYFKGIDLGDIESMRNLANYFNTINEFNKMIICFEMAAEKGDILSMKELAKWYKKSNDTKNMLYWYELAANVYNDIYSILKLGDWYADNEELKLSAYWYKKAAEKGDSNGMHSYAFYLGQIKDFDEMKKYYYMSGDLGNSDSFNNLAVYYECIENYELIFGSRGKKAKCTKN